MMLCASLSLVFEGCSLKASEDLPQFLPSFRVLFGLILGVGFIYLAKTVLDKYEEMKLDIDGNYLEAAGSISFVTVTCPSREPLRFPVFVIQ